MKYAYQHNQTVGTTGFFSCVPLEGFSFGKLLGQLELSPRDAYLRKHLLLKFASLSSRQLKALACLAGKSQRRRSLAGLLLEYAAIKGSTCLFSLDELDKNCLEPPLEWLFLKSHTSGKLAALRSGGRIFGENMQKHSSISQKDFLSAASSYNEQDIANACTAMLENRDTLNTLRQQRSVVQEDTPDVSQILVRALDALENAGLLAGKEMRHEKSLSPIGLLREWHLCATTFDGPVESRLSGIATAYGRGLTIPAARASLAMEIVERASAHAEIRFDGIKGEVMGRRQDMPLVLASACELREKGLEFAFPKTPFPFEIWKNIKLKWIEGCDCAGNAVLVPVQAVFLFCNLNEPEIFASSGSTGLASGSSMEYARLSGLMEVVERDAAATTPYYSASCFALKSKDRRIQGLLDDYAAQGINVQFQDISTEFGPPAFRCFVIKRDGEICQAAAAALDGKKALLSALTETPWEYSYGRPHGFASMPPVMRLPRVYLEDLPNLSLGSVSADLKLVEDALALQCIKPVYVDLTRKDLDLPVCRVIVPQMEVTADFDDFVLPSTRLVARGQLVFQYSATS